MAEIIKENREFTRYEIGGGDGLPQASRTRATSTRSTTPNAHGTAEQRVQGPKSAFADDGSKKADANAKLSPFYANGTPGKN